MLNKKKVEHYVGLVAKEHGLTKKQTRKILVYALKNMTFMIKKGEDVGIRGFGDIYFDKKSYSKYIRVIREKSKTNK